MEIFNDIIGLCLTYFQFLFTDLNPYPESKEIVAWCYTGLTVIMFGTNFSVMA
jgi:hypothetical protein